MAFCADGGGGTAVAFDADGEVTFVAFDDGGEVTFVVFDAGGGGDGVDGAGGGGKGEERAHALGGPSVDEDPSTRTYDASHADAPSNIFSMSNVNIMELVSQSEMSASNADASPNISLMSVAELVSQSEMSALNADAP